MGSKVCEYCGRELKTAVVCFGSESMESVERCRCRIKAEEEQIYKEIRECQLNSLKMMSGMSARGFDNTFDTLKEDKPNEKVKQVCEEYARNFKGIGKNKNGLLIVGGYGTGKTHLADAIANELFKQDIQVINKTMQDLLSGIKRAFKNGNDDDVLEEYKSVPLLIIDDIGKEQGTEWAVSTIYDIINGRYERYMPIVITTNFNSVKLKEALGNGSIAEALVDRLFEVCVPLILSGSSWRVK